MKNLTFYRFEKFVRKYRKDIYFFRPSRAKIPLGAISTSRRDLARIPCETLQEFLSKLQIHY